MRHLSASRLTLAIVFCSSFESLALVDMYTKTNVDDACHSFIVSDRRLLCFELVSARSQAWCLPGGVEACLL